MYYDLVMKHHPQASVWSICSWWACYLEKLWGELGRSSWRKWVTGRGRGVAWKTRHGSQTSPFSLLPAHHELKKPLSPRLPPPQYSAPANGGRQAWTEPSRTLNGNQPLPPVIVSVRLLKVLGSNAQVNSILNTSHPRVLIP